MKVYGYVRVSTKKQSEKMQLDAIHAFSRIDKMFSEGAFTGTTTNRDKFQELVKQVNKDIADGEQVTIIFYSVSRMSRNAKEGIEQYFEWYDKGVELVFLNEHHIDTAVYRKAVNNAISLHINSDKASTNKFFNTMIAAMNELQRDIATEQIELAFAQAEKEVQDLHKRTSDGMRASGASEKIAAARTGQTFTTLKELKTRISMLECLKDFGGQQNIARFAADRSLSRVTVYKYRDAIKADLQTMSKEQAIKQYSKIIKDKAPKEQDQ
jgi:DNA invertase Pin-like site-specific DNA recombinase